MITCGNLEPSSSESSYDLCIFSTKLCENPAQIVAFIFLRSSILFAFIDLPQWAVAQWHRDPNWYLLKVHLKVEYVGVTDMFNFSEEKKSLPTVQVMANRKNALLPSKFFLDEMNITFSHTFSHFLLLLNP